MSKRLTATSGFFLMLALLLYLDGGVLFWAALSAALFHELAHYAAARTCGATLHCLRLTAVGAEMELRSQILTYPAELAIAAAGPLANLLLALLLANLPALPNRFLLAGVHLSLGVFNLLPVAPLDGSQILRSALSALASPAWGQRCANALSLLLSAVLVLFGIVAFLRGSNPSLLVTAFWLLSRNLPQKNRPCSR